MASLEVNALGLRFRLGAWSLAFSLVFISCGAAAQDLSAHGGNILAWGSNERGQLGINSNAAKVASPTMSDTLWLGWMGKNVTKVEAARSQNAGEYSLALTSNGEIWAFGDCSSGNLGVNRTSCDVSNCVRGSSSIKCQKEPHKVDFSAFRNEPWYPPHIIDVAAADQFALALDSSGRLFGWGNPQKAGVGNGCCASDTQCPACQGCEGPAWACYYYRPTLSSAVNTTYLGSKVSKIVAGSDFALAVAADGSVWGWGNNNEGQLGLGYKNVSIIHTPIRNPFISNPKDLRVGSIHAIALMQDGSVYTWGSGELGATGHGLDLSNNPINLDRPRQLYQAGQAKGIAAGKQFSFVIQANGEVMGFGANTKGQLGLPFLSSTQLCGLGQNCLFFPVKVFSLPENVIDIQAGEAHSLALTVDNKVYTTGDNSFSQLGLSSCGTGQTACRAFVQIPDLADHKVIAVAAGLQWSLAIQPILDPPDFFPAPGQYGEMPLSLSHPEVGVDIHFTTSVGGSATWPDVQHPIFQSLELVADPSPYNVKARASCSPSTMCGKSKSAVVEATYRITKTASPPEFGNTLGTLQYLCVDGANAGSWCGLQGRGQLDTTTCTGGGQCVQWTGVWQDSATLSLTASPASALVYFTTDGTTPRETSMRYLEPISLPGIGNFTVKAIAMAPGHHESRVSTALFSVEVKENVINVTEEKGTDWIVIILGALAGLAVVLIAVAICFYRRSKKWKRRVVDAAEEHLQSMQHRPKLEMQTYEEAGQKFHVVQGDGVFRPLSDQALQGFEVEQETHDSGEAKRQWTDEDAIKYAEFQEALKWRRLTEEEARRHEHLHKTYEAQQAGWDQGGHHKHGNRSPLKSKHLASRDTSPIGRTRSGQSEDDMGRLSSTHSRKSSNEDSGHHRHHHRHHSPEDDDKEHSHHRHHHRHHHRNHSPDGDGRAHHHHRHGSQSPLRSHRSSSRSQSPHNRRGEGLNEEGHSKHHHHHHRHHHHHHHHHGHDKGDSRQFQSSPMQQQRKKPADHKPFQSIDAALANNSKPMLKKSGSDTSFNATPRANSLGKQSSFQHSPRRPAGLGDGEDDGLFNPSGKLAIPGHLGPRDLDSDE